jgi:hypothetical protein
VGASDAETAVGLGIFAFAGVKSAWELAPNPSAAKAALVLRHMRHG